jgi:hypothetical protein
MQISESSYIAHDLKSISQIYEGHNMMKGFKL